MLLEIVEIRICRNRLLVWNGFGSNMIKMLFLSFSFVSCTRSMWDWFQRIGLFINIRHSNVVWKWFSSVSTWIHHGGRQYVFIEWLAYNFTVTQIWTVGSFYRLFFRIKAHPLTCIYMLDQTKVRKIDVTRRDSGNFKVVFPLLNKRICL